MERNARMRQNVRVDTASRADMLVHQLVGVAFSRSSPCPRTARHAAQFPKRRVFWTNVPAAAGVCHCC